MADYIDRSEAKQLLLNYGDSFGANLIEKVPAADIRANRIGQWQTDEDGFYFHCSECGKLGDLVGNWKFCPNCGASMQTEKKAERS
jgi:predicted RNA-binding Zn-ribbon protein involved in translation (DUF1610 family)